MKVDALVKVAKKVLTYTILRSTPLSTLAKAFPNKSLNEILEYTDPEMVINF